MATMDIAGFSIEPSFTCMFVTTSLIILFYLVMFLTRKIHAFIYDSTTLEYQVGKDFKCKLKTVGKRYAETGYGIAFPKRSQWVREVNRVLLLMQENGRSHIFKVMSKTCIGMM